MCGARDPLAYKSRTVHVIGYSWNSLAIIVEIYS